MTDTDIKEILKKTKCGGCYKNCDLLYPLCDIGESRAKKLIQKIKEKHV